MTNTKPHIILLGCGNMGNAILNGLIHSNTALKIDILDPFKQPEKHWPDNISVHDTPPNKINDLNTQKVIILAVKPQIIDDAIRSIDHLIGRDSLVLSIAAGKTLNNIQNNITADAAIIRTMPNTPAAIGQGITGAFANPNVTTDQKTISENIISAIGQTVWLENEDQLDAVTAVSGSGPAYLFHMIESLTQASIAQGLPKDLSEKLARQTIIGSSALAKQNPEIPAATLRENVTSPGGTTEAALTILMDKQNGLSQLMEKAVTKAKQRSEELKS